MTEQQAEAFSAALGAEIAYWRKRHGLTREQLAELVDTSATTVGRIERGKDSSASAPLVWRIAKALDLQLSDLMRRAEGAVEMSEAAPSLRAVANEGDREPFPGDDA